MSEQLTFSELTEIAREAMSENGFLIEFPPEVRAEIAALVNHEIESSGVRDLRNLLWSSIDNESSRDLDQVEYAEELSNGDVRLLVGIADVDEYAPKNSAIDDFARQNTITVYTESSIFPMLPEELSTDLTSLIENADRLAVIVEMTVCKNGEVKGTNIYRALIHNYAKLSYEEIGAWLDAKGKLPEKFAQVRGLQEQIFLQKLAASRLQNFRREKGALEFETIESSPVYAGGEIVNLAVVQTNSARKIIENFMIAANVETAEFLESRGVASLRRAVEIPARWEGIRRVAESVGEELPSTPDSRSLADFLASRRTADPVHFPDLSLSIVKLLGAGDYAVKSSGEDGDGHFGLAVRDYAHSTAPNRRYADLVVQRQVKAVLQKENAPYSIEELKAIADRCNERESRSRKVERKMRKIVAATVMQSRIGESFEAIVTGVTTSGTFARILRPPVDGRIVEGEKSVQIGERIKVQLLAANPENGFIDFAVRL